MANKKMVANGYQHHKGIIRDNAVFALLSEPLFRQRVEKKLKGKGSYQRKAKHVSKYFEKSDDKIFTQEILSSGFLAFN